MLALDSKGEPVSITGCASSFCDLSAADGWAIAPGWVKAPDSRAKVWSQAYQAVTGATFFCCNEAKRIKALDPC